MDQAAIAWWPADELLSGVEMEDSSARQISKQRERNQGSSRRASSRRAGFTRKPLFELLEGRRLLAADFGDAPAPYPTLLAANGAQHAELGAESLRLGATITYEADGQPSANAGADSGDDGVVFGEVRVGQLDAAVTVAVANALAGAKLDGWIDFNGDGSWGGAEERIFASVVVAEGVNTLTFDVPSGALSGETYARFRLSTAEGLGVTGLAADGEVEDYRVLIGTPASSSSVFADAKVVADNMTRVQGLRVADLDGDGDVDIISASTDDSDIYWHENDGAGTFVSHLVSGEAYRVDAATPVDLDGDGDLDLVATMRGTGAFTWHQNDGSQGFTQHVLQSAAFDITDIHPVDLDGDGDIDLVTSNRGDKGVTWFENAGQRQFVKRVINTNAQYINAVYAADMDADGDVDIVYGTRDDRLVLLANNGFQAFTPQTISSAAGDIKQVRVARLDGDSTPDILVGAEGSSGVASNISTVVAYERQANGQFTATTIAGDIQFITSFDTADIDGDADLDLIIASFADDAISLFNNRGIEGFSRQTVTTAINGPAWVAAADMDGDGDLDVVTSSQESSAIRWFEKVVDAYLVPAQGVATEGDAHEIGFEVRIEQPQDEPMELFVALSGEATLGEDYLLPSVTIIHQQLVKILLSPGETSAVVSLAVIDDAESELVETVTLTLVDGPGYRARSSSNASLLIRSDEHAADFGDAPLPYPLSTSGNGARHLAHQIDSLRLGPTVSVEEDGQPSADAGADAGADTGDDGVVFGEVRVGQLDAAVTVTVANAPAGAKLDGWIDFDGDGSWGGAEERIFASVVVAEGVNTLTFDVPSGALSGETYARFRLSTAEGLGVTGLAADGEVEDYAVTISAPISTGGHFTSTGLLDSSGKRAASMAAADMDSDGDIDLVTTTSSSEIVWRQNNGSQGFVTRVVTTSATSAGGLFTADMDGDGDTDILVAEGSGSGVVWYENRLFGAFVKRTILQSYVAGGLLAVDMDGDGDMDVVATRQSSGDVRWFENDGAENFVSSTIATGIEGVASPKAIDLDRDGDIDILISIVSTSADNRPLWLENDGAQVFTKGLIAESLDNGFNVRVAADIDEDGDIDLVGWYSNDDAIAWLENSGTQQFTERVLPIVENVNSVLAADVDGDGDLDLVGASSLDQTIAWYENNSAQFDAKHLIAYQQRFAGSLLAIDIDQDGDLDLVSNGGDPSYPTVFENRIAASLTSAGASVAESPESPLVFHFQLGVPQAQNTTLQVQIGGTALAGFDYAITGVASYHASTRRATVIIPAGVTSATLVATPFADDVAEFAETVSVELLPGDGYTIVTPGLQTGAILSGDLVGDLGDAPHRTLLIDDGARHLVAGETPLRLGATISADSDGQPSEDADADDSDDGVLFGTLYAGAVRAPIEVTVANAPAGAKLDAWIDFDGDGVWSGANEKVFHSVSVVNGVNLLFVDVPATVRPGQVDARFRLSTQGGLGVGGAAADGEVEDYAVTIDPPGAEQGIFGAGQAIGTAESGLRDLIAIDLDRDGDIDVVSAASLNDTLAWYENDGAENFTRRVISNTVNGVLSIAVADMDRDGDLDVLSASYLDYKVAWYENNGSQTFTQRVILPNEHSVSYVRAVDMDGDSDLDVLIGAFAGGKIAWMENNGSQQFTQRVIATGVPNEKLKAADIDGDGDIDLVAGAALVDGFAWYENDGLEGFTRHVLPQLTTTTYAVEPLDLDGDGDLDLLLASAGALRWYENQGDRTFVSRSSPLNGTSANEAIAADIDGDGDLDVLSSRGTWLFNDGQQNFVLKDPGWNGASSYSIADMDGDGVLDLVAGSYDGGWIEWRKNGFSASLTADVQALSEANADTATIVLTLDEARDQPTTLNFSVAGTAVFGEDYAVSGQDSFNGTTGTITVPAGQSSVALSLTILNDNLPEFDESLTITLLGGTLYKALGATTHSLTLFSEDHLGDFGDAPAPYPTTLAKGGPLHFGPGAGSLRLGPEVSSDFDGKPSVNALGDDGDDGVVFGPMRVGQRGAEVTVTVSNAPAGAKLDGWIDFNGDGSWGGAGEQVFVSVPVVEEENLLRFDVPTVIASGVVTYARFRVSTEGGLGHGGVAADGEVEDYAVTITSPTATDGVFGTPSQVLAASAIRPIASNAASSVAPADMDGDGDIDLVVSRGFTSNTLYWYENQAGDFSTTHLIGQGADFIRLVDLDRDGDLDVVATDLSTLAWHENRGAEGFVRHLIVSTTLRSPITPIAVADFNADGWLDIAIVNNAGSVLLWSRSEATANYTSVSIGAATSGVVDLEAADFDGDGRLDLIASGNTITSQIIGFFQTASGQFVRRSIVTGLTTALTPVDMDRDGDVDLVAQGENSVYWLDNNGSGAFTSRGIGAASGFSNDVAVADFDGDGDIDIVDARRNTSFEVQSFNLFTNDGSQGFQKSTIAPHPSSSYFSLLAADLNGDGAIDLVAIAPQVGVRLYAQTLRATPTSTSSTILPEGSAPITVRLELQSEASTDLVIPFTISGESAYGVDYVIDGADSITGGSGLATIPAGSRWVELTLSVIADGAPELFESLVISVGARPGDQLVRWIAADAAAGDYGDAPATYPVGVEQSGAAHLAVGPRLGASRTTELEGVATSSADGDAGDDGVLFGTLVVGAGTSTMTVDVQNAPEGAYIDAWIDFNGDGSWSGEREQVFARRAVVEGENVLRFETPGWATAGVTFVRVRLSSAGGLGVMGNAVDGEVEDFRLTIASPLGGWVEYEIDGVDPAGSPFATAKPVDIDRDGLVDIVAAGSGSNRNVYWLRNEGGGEYSTHLLAVVDNFMRDLAVDDVDGDGDLDIVVASQPSTSGSRLVLLRNDGANSFTLSVIASNVEASRSVTLVDLNGDGTMDIVAGGYRGNQFSTSSLAGEIAWYTNDGSGNFTPRPVDSQLGPVVNVGAADLDGDGDLDLYASAMNAGSLLMYRNDGAAGFTKQVVVATPPIGSQMYIGGRVRAADMDGDGDLDLIAASGTFGPPRVVWYDNNGDGAFVERVAYAGASYSNDILPADLDGDGDLDLAMAYVPGAPGDRPAWIETRLGGDVNNDGVVDLADRDFWRANYGSTSGPGLIADLTGDGLVDAADYTRWRDAYDSGVASVVYLPRIAAWRLEASSLAAADWDGDLDLDLVAATSGGIVIARNSFALPSPSLAFVESGEVDSEDRVEPASDISPRLASYPLSVMPEAPAPRLRYSTPVRTTEPDRSRNLLQLLVRSVEGPLEPRIVDEAFALTDSSNSNIREPSDPDFAEALAFNRLSPGTPFGWDES